MDKNGVPKKHWQPLGGYVGSARLSATVTWPEPIPSVSTLYINPNVRLREMPAGIQWAGCLTFPARPEV